MTPRGEGNPARRVAEDCEHDGAFGACVGCIRRALAEAVEAARERAAGIARNPYGDDVRALGNDEPLVVGRKISAAIMRARAAARPGGEGAK